MDCRLLPIIRHQPHVKRLLETWTTLTTSLEKRPPVFSQLIMADQSSCLPSLLLPALHSLVHPLPSTESTMPPQTTEPGRVSTISSGFITTLIVSSAGNGPHCKGYRPHDTWKVHSPRIWTARSISFQLLLPSIEWSPFQENKTGEKLYCCKKSYKRRHCEWYYYMVWQCRRWFWP